jgi:uncharacterized RDD family membrane protein YckC
MRRYIATVVIWVLLALTTLLLVVRDENSLIAALVAWTGGLITYRLGEQSYEMYQNRSV